MDKKAKRKASHKTATSSSKQSYENLAGHPMDVMDHPVNNKPEPMGGLHQGVGLDMMAGSPNPSDYGV